LGDIKSEDKRVCDGNLQLYIARFSLPPRLQRIRSVPEQGIQAPKRVGDGGIALPSVFDRVIKTLQFQPKKLKFESPLWSK
jgi:hypothetical protein